MTEQTNQPFKAVHDLVMPVWKSHAAYSKINPFKAMALIIKESFGLPFWCECDLLAKSNLQHMEEITGIKGQDFIDYNMVKNGPHAHEFPKFRFELIWWSQMRTSAHCKDFTKMEMASMSSSWGLGQKSAWYLLGKLPRQQAILKLKEFQASPETQVDQVFMDLDALDHDRKQPFDLVATRYNAGASARKVSNYGVDANHLFGVLSNAYQKEI